MNNNQNAEIKTVIVILTILALLGFLDIVHEVKEAKKSAQPKTPIKRDADKIYIPMHKEYTTNQIGTNMWLMPDTTNK